MISYFNFKPNKIESLRALYLGDNELDSISSEIYKLENLNIVNIVFDHIYKALLT